jgi:hypothetical protein
MRREFSARTKWLAYQRAQVRWDARPGKQSEVTAMFTDVQKQEEAERELKMRRRYYPGMVEKGKLTREKADRQIALMTEIAADYKARSELPP